MGDIKSRTKNHLIKHRHRHKHNDDDDESNTTKETKISDRNGM